MKTLDDLKREMRNPVEQGGKSNDWYQNGYDVGWNAAIDYLHAQGRIVPDGYVAVPLQPTAEMIDAGVNRARGIMWNPNVDDFYRMKVGYQTMIAAARKVGE